MINTKKFILIIFLVATLSSNEIIAQLLPFDTAGLKYVKAHSTYTTYDLGECLLLLPNKILTNYPLVKNGHKIYCIKNYSIREKLKMKIALDSAIICANRKQRIEYGPSLAPLNHLFFLKLFVDKLHRKEPSTNIEIIIHIWQQEYDTDSTNTPPNRKKEVIVVLHKSWGTYASSYQLKLYTFENYLWKDVTTERLPKITLEDFFTSEKLKGISAEKINNPSLIIHLQGRTFDVSLRKELLPKSLKNELSKLKSNPIKECYWTGYKFEKLDGFKDDDLQ